MNPAVIAAAIASAEANVTALEALAVSKAGTPTELDAVVLVTAAHRITSNLRKLLDASDRREESDGADLSRAILTRRRLKCIAAEVHTATGTCPRCGLTNGDPQ
jgi:hypothetical protein